MRSRPLSPPFLTKGCCIHTRRFPSSLGSVPGQSHSFSFAFSDAEALLFCKREEDRQEGEK